jgi:hypothetical protein
VLIAKTIPAMTFIALSETLICISILPPPHGSAFFLGKPKEKQWQIGKQNNYINIL